MTPSVSARGPTTAPYRRTRAAAFSPTSEPSRKKRTNVRPSTGHAEETEAMLNRWGRLSSLWLFWAWSPASPDRVGDSWARKACSHFLPPASSSRGSLGR